MVLQGIGNPCPSGRPGSIPGGGVIVAGSHTFTRICNPVSGLIHLKFVRMKVPKNQNDFSGLVAACFLEIFI